MTESQGPAGAESPNAAADNSARNAERILVPIAIAWIIGLTCLVGLLCGISAFEQLLLGWIYFPLTVLPRVTVDWPSVLVGVLALGLFLVVLHRTLRWLLRPGGTFSPSEKPLGLWRATFAVAGIFLLMLGAGTAIVGAVHQATWIATARTSPAAGQPVPEPVFGAIANSKVSMRRSTVKWKLQEMGIAVEGYEESYRQLPPGGTMDDQGRLYHGWATYLSGFLGFSRQGINFSIPWNEAPNDRLYQCQLEVFVNPQVEEIFDRDGYGLNHFAGNLQVLRFARLPIPRDPPFTDFIETARSSPDAHRRNLPLRISEITDGAANTLLIGESRGRFRPWGDPANLRDPALGNGRSLEGFGSPSDRSSALYLMCDGSVRPIGYEIDPKVFAALGSPAGGELLENEQRP